MGKVQFCCSAAKEECTECTLQSEGRITFRVCGSDARGISPASFAPVGDRDRGRSPVNSQFRLKSPTTE